MQARVSLSELGAAVILQAAEWVTPVLRLFMNDVVADPEEELAYFTAPTFTGSAAVAIAAPAVPDPIAGGGLLFPMAPKLFTASAAPAEPETAYGFVIYDTGDANRIIAAGRLPVPVTITAIGDQVYVDPELRVQQTF